MSGFGKKVVDRWNDWQLIVLVLLSLLVQLLLLGTADFRRRTKPRWWRKIYFWTLHVGSRYMITYPLGILSRASTNDPNAAIQAFWAALLLFHLGGRDDFTALTLEDNKIWPRQCFELSVQAFIAAYVFFRYSVDQDFKRFILPFVFISLAGSLKCGEQVFALRQATMEALIKSVLGTTDAGPDYADTMDRVDAILRSGVLPSINIDSTRHRRPNSDSREAGEPRTDQNKRQQLAVDIIRSAHRLFSIFKVLFADGIFSFEDRRESQALFLDKDAEWAFKVIEIELSFVYDRLYTKASVSRTKCGMIIRVVGLLLTLAGSLLALFATIHATQYKLRHRCVTYTLLAGAVLTEAAILARYIYSIWSLVDGDWLRCCSVNLKDRSRWSGHMAQSNLITFCLQKLPSDSKLKGFLVAFSSRRLCGESDILVIRLAQIYALLFAAFNPLVVPGMVLGTEVGGALGAAVRRQYLQRPSVLKQLQSKSFWKKYKKPTRYVLVEEKLKAFIFEEVNKKVGTFDQREEENVLPERVEENQTTGTLDRRRRFADCRADLVLKKEGVDDLGWSFQEKDFDESLLLWHIATDLCSRQDKQGNTETVSLQVFNPGNGSTDQQDRPEDNPGNGSTDQQDCPEDNPGDDQKVREHMGIGTEISNYLLYIMVVHPLMLSSSTTMATKRCRDTCAEARRHFLKEHIQAKFSHGDGAVSEENAHASLLKVETPLRASMVKGDKSKSVLWDGCFLAKELNQITDKGKKWRVICRVWVEMLCYAAVQCGGYQHAERLREGGELITFVCLLMTHLGMGKHYRTEVGDTYAHPTPFTAQSLASRVAPAPSSRNPAGDATISIDEASSSGSGHP